MSATHWLALAGILLTAFLASLRAAAGFIESRVERGDSKLAHAIDALTATVQAIAERMMEADDANDRKLDKIVHEVTNLNDGSTVKGAVVKINADLAEDRHTLADHERRITGLEGYHK